MVTDFIRRQISFSGVGSPSRPDYLALGTRTASAGKSRAREAPVHFHWRARREYHQMKTARSYLRARRQEEGMAVIMVMILVVIVLIYLAGNIRTLHNLGRDLRMIEQQQTRRWAVAAQLTNNVATTNLAPAK